jgi:hypothetical protein
MTLDEVTARLGQHEIVSGLLLIGSAARGDLTPSSDVDLVIVLREMPVPLHVGVTYIDGTLTDLIFLRAAQIGKVLALENPVSADAWLGRIIRWLDQGTVLLDRDGRIRQAQAKARSRSFIVSSEHTGYSTWFSINYNLVQTARLLASEDPVYRATADLRMALYAPRDLVFGYFQLRGLRWEGDKAAVRYLTAQDRTYMDLLTQFLSESDSKHRFALYERLAALTVAPVGALWDRGETAMTFEREPVTPEMVEAGLNLWHSLLEPD